MQQVKYLGATDDQVRFGGDNDDPRAVLTIGETYTVEMTDGHRWHTRYSLVGYPGLWFNSVSFEPVTP